MEFGTFAERCGNQIGGSVVNGIAAEHKQRLYMARVHFRGQLPQGGESDPGVRPRSGRCRSPYCRYCRARRSLRAPKREPRAIGVAGDDCAGAAMRQEILGQRGNPPGARSGFRRLTARHTAALRSRAKASISVYRSASRWSAFPPVGVISHSTKYRRFNRRADPRTRLREAKS